MRIAAWMFAASLLTAGCSQIVIVPEAPDGTSTNVDVTWDKGSFSFGKQGYAFYIDRMLDVVYRVDAEDIEKDFGPALTSMREMLASGLHDLPHSYTALLETPRGPLGNLAVQVGKAQPVLLDSAGQGIYIDGFPDRPHLIDAERLSRDFGAALVAQTATLKAMESYLALLENPDGYKDKLIYRADDKETVLDQPGQGLTLDGVDRPVTSDEIEKDFEQALATEREILAAGLPELPHSYVILLPHDMGALGRLSFESGDAVVRHLLDRPAEGVIIDGYPDQPRAIDRQHLQRDFGPVLASLVNTLKAMRSYIILLQSPDGLASKVVYRTRGESIYLEHPGQSLTLDGLDNAPDEEQATNDFTPARTSTKQILDEGLPKLPHSYVALVKNPAGPIGEVEILEGKSQGVVLNDSWQAVIIDGYSDKIYALDEEQYLKDFGDSIEALPPPPVTHFLYFQSGSVQLAKESRAAVPHVLEEVRRHPAADISIIGHTDTVGGVEINDRLSQKRSEAVAELIRKSGVPYQEISLAAFGKAVLAVETPDNTPELLNRRVEVTIR